MWSRHLLFAQILDARQALLRTAHPDKKLKEALMKNTEYAVIYNEKKPLRNFIDELIDLRVEN